MEQTKGQINDYFLQIKKDIQMLNEDKLSDELSSCITTAEYFQKSGQMIGLEKLLFLISCIKKELELNKLGFELYVERSSIEAYINIVEEEQKKPISFIELERYERIIPKEIIKNIEKTRHIFDEYYILFTDYSGSYQKMTEKEKERIRIEKDPILFGTFKQDQRLFEYRTYSRLYYLGDWIDEYCDITLEKFVTGLAKNNLYDAVKRIDSETIEDKIRKLNLNFADKKAKESAYKTTKEPFYKVWFNKLLKIFK